MIRINIVQLRFIDEMADHSWFRSGILPVFSDDQSTVCLALNMMNRDSTDTGQTGGSSSHNGLYVAKIQK